MGMYEKFDYDSTSNIIQLDDIVLEYGPGDTLQRQGDTQYLYDANGRLIKKIEDCDSAEPKVWLYEWDAEDQLRSVTTPTGEVWEYKYDALGRRIVKEGPKKTTRFVWDGDVVVHEVENEVINSSWVFDHPSFSPLCKVQNNQLYSVIHDHLGTPRELVDVTGNVVWSATYSAWGSLVQVNSQKVDCPIRFQGQYFDAETGLHYNRFRYYDPQIGQFVQQDPIGLLGGDNLYLYVSNPTRWVDPYGLVDSYDILYSQDSISDSFQNTKDVPERWRGRPVSEAIGEARRTGRLPEGLRLEAMRVNGNWVTLNNRTLYVAREANRLNVNPIDVGPSGLNRLNRLLRNAGLVAPVEDVTVRKECS
jgi:RHS repeat-associated protein